MEIRTLVDIAKARGVTFKIDGDRIVVEARAEPDGETTALLENLRSHRDGLRLYLIAPICGICGAVGNNERDIYGQLHWVCWGCAKTA